MSLIFFVRFIHQLFFSTAVAARSKENHSGEADPQIYVIRGLRGECYTKSYTKFNYNEKLNIGRISAFGFGAAAVRPTCTNRFIEADLTKPHSRFCFFLRRRVVRFVLCSESTAVLSFRVSAAFV